MQEISDRYKTAAGFAESEFVERKSKFIGVAAPVETEEEALALLAAVRKKHRDARHHVYAYQIGLQNEIQRQSDDGEPGGTGGAPLSEILKGNDLRNTVLIVTRYFGGVLLGVGGLRRAYSQAAKDALAAAGAAEKILCERVTVVCGYEKWDAVEREAAKHGFGAPEEVGFSEKVTASFLIERSRVEEFLKIMTEVTDGRGECTL